MLPRNLGSRLQTSTPSTKSSTTNACGRLRAASLLLALSLLLHACTGTPCTTTKALELTWRTSIGPRYLEALGEVPATNADADLHRQLVAEAREFGELLRIAVRGCEGGLTP